MCARRSKPRASFRRVTSNPPEVTELPSPITLGLISDTHLHPDDDRWVPEPILALFRRFGVSRILHIGDVDSQRILDQLGQVAPVLAVEGNNDPVELDLPLRRELRIGSKRILMLHGHELYGKSVPARQLARTVAPGYDCVIYGHSHIPRFEREGESILFNPGSATDRRWHPHFGIGLLHVSEEALRPELILYQTPVELESIMP